MSSDICSCAYENDWRKKAVYSIRTNRKRDICAKKTKIYEEEYVEYLASESNLYIFIIVRHLFSPFRPRAFSALSLVVLWKCFAASLFFRYAFFHLRLTTWTAVRATCYWGLSLCCSLLSPPGIFPALCCIPIPPPSHLSTDSLIITCPYFAFAISLSLGSWLKHY